jgi:hypothetical protein
MIGIRIILPLIFSIATLVAAPAAAQSGAALADNAPDSYTVVKGDTLWGISGRFLKEPWRWPEVWRLNREQISNPHLIYPGQLIVLDRSGPWLSIGRRIGGSTKLSPQVYTEELGTAVPSIPLHVIDPFLTRPLVVDEARLAGAATIVATETSRVLMGSGDTVFAKNVSSDAGVWQVFRPARPLKDPATGEVLAYEADYLGSARVSEHGSPEQGTPATLEIVSAVEEIGIGDLMLPSEGPTVFSYAPHAPEHEVDGRLLSIYRGVAETGALNVVALNVGAEQGLERGHVLALYRNRGVVQYKDEDGVKEDFVLPEKRYGTVFVFRVFDRIAYGLVMETDGHASVGDSARRP